jgi:hypothetical protein
VDVESLTARLPSDTTREVLDIEDNPDFHVLQLRAANPEGPTLPWVFVIDLGYQTRVTKGNMNLRVAGQPRLSIGDEFTMSGELQLLPGGRVPALGRDYIIEHGTLTLNPKDAGNPTLDVRAAWRTPEGETRYAVLHGPWKELDQARLDGPTSGAGSGDEAGDEIQLGLNELVGGSLSDVEVRFDPGENASYTAAVRLSEKLWFEGRYQRDEMATVVGGPSNVISGAFDYHFARKWSLRTELGNAGGTFDLLWQHRY